MTSGTRRFVSSRTRKCQKQDHNLTKDIFHKKDIKPFIDELIKEMKNAFCILNLPDLNAFQKLDPQKITDKDSLLFENYGVEEVTLWHNFYGKGKEDSFQGRTVQTDALYDTQLPCLLLEFSNFKSYVCEQKAALSQEYSGKEKYLKSKFDLFNAQKYKTRKRLKDIEDKLSLITEKVHNPLSVGDLLHDSVIETACPSILQLLKIYVLISISEAIVERGFSKMGQIVTKKCAALDDNSLEMLMRISYNKTPLNTTDVKGVFDKWMKDKDRRIFANEF